MSTRWGLRECVTSALHVVALVGLALAQPLYGLLSQQPDYFVLHGATPLDLFGFALVVSLGLPLVLAACIAAVGLVRGGAGDALLRAVVALGVAASALPVLKAVVPVFAGDARLALPAALGLGVLAAVLYERLAPARMFLGWLSPVGLVFPALFLFFSPVSALLQTAEVEPPASAPEGRDIPVVLLILDELPLSSLLDGQNAIDAERFPNLARFARDAHWFRNATTVAAYTTTAVPAILTGTLNDRRRLTTWSDQPDNLFLLLAGGRGMTVFETSTNLCPPSLCADEMIPERLAERMKNLLWDSGVVYLHILLPNDLALRLPPVNGAWQGFGRKPRRYGAVETDRFLPSGEAAAHPEWALLRSRAHGGQQRLAKLMELIHEGRDSRLYFLHLNLPHIPWLYFPDGAEYAPAPFWPHGVTGRRWGDDDWEVVQGHQRHLLQVGWVDRLVGQLLDELVEVGLYDRALVILVADHGASFRQGDHVREVTGSNQGDILPVPLLVKLPGQREGAVSDHNAETIDILPTIADVLGIEVPWQLDGQSLFAEVGERPRKRAMRTSFLDQVKNRWKFEPLDYDPAAIARDRKESEARVRNRFGRGWGGVFAAGPRPDLLGSSFAALTRDAPPSGLEAELEGAAAFETVDLAGVLPANIHGRFTGRAPAADAQLAIAVGDVVQATTRPYRMPDGATAFSALVPPDAFVAGANPVSVGVVPRGGGTALQVVPLH